MPGFDRTGPEGRGPMTGRGAGYCAGNETPRFTNRGPGYGRGRGRIQSLKTQSDQLQKELDSVNKRVQELKTDKNKDK